MSKRNLLKLPDDLEGNLRALLRTPPPPHDTPGSRKAAPKAARGGARPKGQKAPAATPTPDTEALQAAVEYHQREIERLIKAGAAKPKRKGTRKR